MGRGPAGLPNSAPALSSPRSRSAVVWPSASDAVCMCLQGGRAEPGPAVCPWKETNALSSAREAGGAAVLTHASWQGLKPTATSSSRNCCCSSSSRCSCCCRHRRNLCAAAATVDQPAAGSPVLLQELDSRLQLAQRGQEVLQVGARPRLDHGLHLCLVGGRVGGRDKAGGRAQHGYKSAAPWPCPPSR